MSTQGVAIPTFARRRQAPKEKHPLLQFYERYSPSQGWSTYIFLVLVLFVLGDSVMAAGWVETPGLIGLLSLSALVGLGLSKLRLPAVFLHPIAIAIGFVVILWQATSLADAPSLFAALEEIWSRLNVWYEAASSDGISTDLLPFSLAMLSIAWIIGYISSWFIFRSNNAWVAVVLAGTALLTNLSFLPDRFSSRFFLFTFFAMLLVVRMSIVQKQEIWRRMGVQFTQGTGWLTIHATVWFSIAVLLVAAFLPLKVWVSHTLAEMWSAARAPVESLEEDFARLLAGIPSQKNVHGRFFGDTLPFIGAISFGGEVVLWAQSEYPSYWLSQTYSEYTSQGWKSGETTSIKVGADAVPPPRSDFLKRESVEQTLQLNFSTDDFLSGGSLDWLSHDAVLEILAPKEFNIDLQDASNDYLLPEDLQELAVELRESLEEPPEQFIESFISRELPEDIVLNSVNSHMDEPTETTVLDSVVLERKEEITPDVVSWRFDGRLAQNEPYSMVSFVSVATDEDLRSASTDYSSFITDHYLQLPPTLPQRVRDKALELTEGADNPLDKALAIQEYLRSNEFTYSQDIEAPPRGADGVDYFLFETKTGYSDYFASSMTVLMRAAGVPARMAAGYAPGEYHEESGYRVVRDFDSHGWVQVYFPDYGWIDFEPTPAWPTHERQLLTDPATDVPVSEGPFAYGGEGELFPFLPEDETAGAVDLSGLNPPRETWDPAGLITRMGMGLGAAAGLWLIGFLAWNWGLWKASPVDRAYAKMTRLGTLAGISRREDQTPVEYAAAVSSLIGEHGPAAQRIGWAFASSRYAQNHREPTEQDRQELDGAWKSLRGSLLGQAVRRLTPGGGNHRQ